MADNQQKEVRALLLNMVVRIICQSRNPSELPGQFKEIGQDLFAAFRQDGFGVELDAPDGVGFVAKMPS